MYYASIGIKQIQSYLGRSRHLWGRRGASDMLFYLTDSSGKTDDISGTERNLCTVREILDKHDNVEINCDAVDVDGVIHIQGSERQEVSAAAADLAHNIMGYLPAAHVDTVLWENASYIEVIRAESRGEGPLEKHSYPPMVIEFPLAYHCDECSSGMAVEEHEDPEERSEPDRQLIRLCADCSSRFEGRRNRTLRNAIRCKAGGGVLGFMAEQQILGELNLDQVENLVELARLGGLKEGEGRRTHTGNHIATIFADGNGLGALFADARGKPTAKGDTKDVRNLSIAVKKAIKGGLIEAINAIRDASDKNVMAAVPHILGGDDVLISVPATRAWTFLIKLMESMREGLKDDELLGSKGISFSAGMVICHQAHPIGDQVSLAESLLRQAKNKVKGGDWSFAWQDVTNEGPRPIADRVQTLDFWRATEPIRAAVEDLGRSDKRGNSARNNLRQELQISCPRTRTIHLQHLAERLEGAKELFDLAFDREWNRREEISDKETEILLTVLQMMRWMP